MYFYHLRSFILGSSTTQIKKIKIISLLTSLKWPHSLRAQFFQFHPKKIFQDFFPIFFVNQLNKNNHIARAAACIRIRPFQLKSGEKYHMLRGRKVSDFHRV